MDNMDFGKLNLFYHRHNILGEAKKLALVKLTYNELTLVTEGSMTYVIDGTECVLSKGDIIFVPTGAMRYRKKVSKSDFVSFNFYSDKPITCFQFHAKQAIDNEVKTLLKYYDVCTANHLSHVNEKCLNILNSLMISLYEFYNAPKYSKLTLEIIKYLKDNIQEQLTLKDIEKKVFFSPFYFCKKFKNEMGVSIIQYFNTMKIEQAKMLIFENAMSLEEIAFSLGFSDYNYFSRLFKKITKSSPKKFKSNI